MVIKFAMCYICVTFDSNAHTANSASTKNLNIISMYDKSTVFWKTIYRWNKFKLYLQIKNLIKLISVIQENMLQH